MSHCGTRLDVSHLSEIWVVQAMRLPAGPLPLGIRRKSSFPDKFGVTHPQMLSKRAGLGQQAKHALAKTAAVLHDRYRGRTESELTLFSVH